MYELCVLTGELGRRICQAWLPLWNLINEVELKLFGVILAISGRMSPEGPLRDPSRRRKEVRLGRSVNLGACVPTVGATRLIGPPNA